MLRYIDRDPLDRYFPELEIEGATLSHASAWIDAGLGVMDDREVWLVPREGGLYILGRLDLHEFLVTTPLRAAALLEAAFEDFGSSSLLD